MKSIICFLIAALTVSACSGGLQKPEPEKEEKKEEGGQQHEQQEKQTFTLTATTSSFTKAGIGNSLDVLWHAGDRIGLVDESGNITPAILDASSAGKSEGKFSYEAPSQIAVKYAYYPYSENGGLCDQSVSGSILSISLKSSQQMSMDKTCVSPNTLIMAGKPDAQGVIAFRNTCALACIRLSGKDNYVRRVYLQATDRKISGVGTLDLASDAPVFRTSAVNEVDEMYDSALLAQRCVAAELNPQDGSDNRLHVTPSGASATKTGVDPDVFLVIPAGDYPNLFIETLGNTGAVAMDDAADVDLSLPLQKSLLFDVGKILDLNAVMEMPVAADLGKRANSFVIENLEGGTYCFSTLTGGTAYVDNVQRTVTATGNYATLLWEDAEGLVSDVRSDNGGKKIYFTLGGGKKGNAVIALRSRNGKIQWNWHIWVAGEKIQERRFGDVVFMDRNLGALSSHVTGTGAEAAGLCYQWGRKDPFPGAEDFAAAQAASTKGAVDSKNVFPDIIVKDMAQEGEELALAAALPYVYIWGSENGSGAEDWCSDLPQDGNLWGNAGITKPKTIYDPCPYGYRVPTKSNFETGVVERAKAEERINYSVTIKDDDGKDFVLPTCGYWRRSVNATEMCNVGSHCWLWTMTSSATNDVLNSDYQGAVVFQTTTKSSGTVRKTPRRWGAGVRCVKFDEDAIQIL